MTGSRGYTIKRLVCNSFALRSSKCGASNRNNCSAHDGKLQVCAKQSSQYGNPKCAMHIRKYSENDSAKNCHLFDCISSKYIFGLIDSNVSYTKQTCKPNSIKTFKFIRSFQKQNKYLRNIQNGTQFKNL